MATLSTTRATHSRGSVIDQKLADLNAMGANINAAIDRVLPADTQPFSSVAVLFMKWKYNDILSIASLEAELAGIFKNVYGFTVEYYEIDVPIDLQFAQLDSAASKLEKSQNLTDIVEDRLTNFAKKHNADPRSLAILVYSGHSVISADKTTMRLKEADGLNTAPTPVYVKYGPLVDFRYCSNRLQRSKGRTLFVFDSCYSGSIGFANGPEVLAACASTEEASGQEANSFTRGLITELESQNGEAFTVATLHSRMYRSATLKTRPVTVLSLDGKPSIVLAKLHGSTRVARQLGSGPSDIRALISVQFAHNLPNPSVGQFEEWLTTNVPSNISGLKIQFVALHETNSRLGIFTVPIEIFESLPQDSTTYKFIAMVKSGNLLLEQDGEDEEEDEDMDATRVDDVAFSPTKKMSSPDSSSGGSGSRFYN